MQRYFCTFFFLKGPLRLYKLQAHKTSIYPACRFYRLHSLFFESGQEDYSRDSAGRTGGAQYKLSTSLPCSDLAIQSVVCGYGDQLFWFPGLSGFLRCKTFSAKPRKSGANLDKFLTLSSDQQPWFQPGGLLEMQRFKPHSRPSESESAFSKNSRSFRGILKMEGSAFPKKRRTHTSPEMGAFKGLIFR